MKSLPKRKLSEKSGDAVATVPSENSRSEYGRKFEFEKLENHGLEHSLRGGSDLEYTVKMYQKAWNVFLRNFSSPQKFLKAQFKRTYSFPLK